jgi:hypothetical protein
VYTASQVQDLQAELAEKQEQLQTLSLENLALVAKARALEQLVKSAGGFRVQLCARGDITMLSLSVNLHCDAAMLKCPQARLYAE